MIFKLTEALLVAVTVISIGAIATAFPQEQPCRRLLQLVSHSRS